MAENSYGAFNNVRNSDRNDDLDQSFVGKLVTGFLSTTRIGKWFKSSTDSTDFSRTRGIDDDSETTALQPPTKRQKLPSTEESDSFTNIPSTSTTNIVYGGTDRLNRFSNISRPSTSHSEPAESSYNTLFDRNSDQYKQFTSTVKSTEKSDSNFHSSTQAESHIKKSISHTNKREDTSASESTVKSLFSTSMTNKSSRSIFPTARQRLNTKSLSTTRPSFDSSLLQASVTASSSQHDPKDKIFNSPFYSGPTTYGGASSYSTRIYEYGRESEQKRPRPTIQIKPVNRNTSSENACLSKTARRILATLEEYTTASEVKSISQQSKKPKGILEKYTGVSPYVIRKTLRTSNTELLTPSVPELIQLKNIQRLQNTTENIREITTTLKPNKSVTDYSLHVDNEQKNTYTNKMKTPVTSTFRSRQKEVSEEVTQPNLPNIPLPIASLPKFDLNFSLTDKAPLVKSTSDNSHAKCDENTEKCIETNVVNPVESSFKFADPILIAKNVNSLISINEFIFNEPLVKKGRMANVSFKANNTSQHINSSYGQIKTVNNGVKETIANINSSEKPSVSNIGSNDKVLRKCSTKTSKNEMQTSENPTSQLNVSRNQNVTSSVKETNGAHDKNAVQCEVCKKLRKEGQCNECTACQNKSGKSGSQIPLFNFGAQKDTWTCSVCLVPNKNDKLRCAACTNLKPVPTTNNITNNTINSVKTVINNNSFSTDPPALKQNLDISKDWNCASCMIKNSFDTTNCSCCGGSKTGELITTNSTAKPVVIGNLNIGIHDMEKTEFAEKKANPIVIEPFPQLKPKENSVVISSPETVNSEHILKVPESLPEIIAAPLKIQPQKTPINTTSFQLNSSPITSSDKKSDDSSKISFSIATQPEKVPAPIVKEPPVFSFKPTVSNGDLVKTPLFPLSKLPSTESVPKVNCVSTTTQSISGPFNFTSSAPTPMTTPTTVTNPTSNIFQFSPLPPTTVQQSSFGSNTRGGINGEIPESNNINKPFGTFGNAKPFVFGNANTVPNSVENNSKFSFTLNSSPALVSTAPTFSPPTFNSNQPPMKNDNNTGFKFTPYVPPTFNFGSNNPQGFGNTATSNIFSGGFQNTTVQTSKTEQTPAPTVKNNVFTFGSSNQVPSLSNTGFNFGASSVVNNNAPSGVFKFSASVPFNTNLQDSPNIAAPPAITDRVIKKAVRRTQR